VRVCDKNGVGLGASRVNRIYGLPSLFVRPGGPFGPNVFDPLLEMADPLFHAGQCITERQRVGPGRAYNAS